MGLQVNYTDKSGKEWVNSYWVISNFNLCKKFHTTPDHAIDIVPNAEKAPAWITTPGYHSRLVVMGWETKESRERGDNPRFINSVYPTDFVTPDNSYYETVEDHQYRVEFDMNSSENFITQAYNYVANNIDTFKGSTIV
jgi:hypothetical protein